MDGSASLRLIQVVGAAIFVALAILMSACSSNTAVTVVGTDSTLQDGSGLREFEEPIFPPGTVLIPPTARTVLAQVIDYEEGIQMFEGDEYQLLTRRREVPDDLPETAHRMIRFGRGEHADPSQRPEELVVATPWPRPVGVNVLCLVDGVQVACSEDAYMWRVELEEPGLALLPIPTDEGRRDVVLLEDRDSRPEGFWPVSDVRAMDEAEVPYSWVGEPPPEIISPFGGCDFVLLRDNPYGWTPPRPLFETSADNPVYMYVSICPEYEKEKFVIYPFVILNETVVVKIDGFHPFIAEPGKTYAWRIPEELVQSGNIIRVAVSLVAKNINLVRWITHPVYITDPQ